MIKVAIVGVSGYTGIELTKIILNHPEFKLEYISGSSLDNVGISEIMPFMDSISDLKIVKTNTQDILKKCDIVFLATPHKESMKYVKEMYGKIKIIDLSADYRLSLDNYEKYYTNHIDKKNLKNCSYGLPELYRKEIKASSLVANPGCYPTASILSLAPFLPFLNENNYIFIDAKSGLSGAGKKLSNVAHFSNMNENLLVYSPYKHRHLPEIKQKILDISNKNLNIKFTPTLIPTTRGMQVNVYISNFKEPNISKIINDFYENEYFIRIKNNPTDIKSVNGTNFCDIFTISDDDSLLINTSIDNLLRGASSQAVVNANLICGLDENLAIPKIASMP